MGYSYSAPQWLLVFFLYCVLGWCFETTVVSVKQRHFVNRGFLRGPMLTIYGFGAFPSVRLSILPECSRSSTVCASRALSFVRS